ncbi:MAG: 1-acyl-sn-glycerol-3-phosphate acyltransferase [Balneolaceae bacterium]|nr:1-acyl-sn-glycerol-3-phosphate acyltransferase [Balneolaceae bacterium]
MSERNLDIEVKGWTFTHWWVRPVVWSWFKIYHRSFTISGMKHVEWSKPIIFAPTHQSAFTDALCLILPAGYANDRFIYPLVRADVFHNSRLVDWLLTSFHMMPVYRPRDRVDLLAQNRRVFDRCRQQLEKNRNLLIHAEGNCIARKSVRPFKKGLARIALETLDSGNDVADLQIIPVGINYRNITEPRYGIHVRYGPGVNAADFMGQYAENKSRAISRLTDTIEAGVRDLAVDIKKEDHYQLMEDVLHLARISDERFRDHAPYTQEELALYKKTVRNFENAVERDSTLAISLEESLNKLKLMLKHYRLDWDLSLIPRMTTRNFVLKGLLLLLAAPAVIYGWLNNLVPWKLTQRSADPVDDEQFKSSIELVAGLLLFPVFYLIQAGFIYLLTDSWQWALAYLLSLPLSGILSINLWEQFLCWRQQLRLRWMEKMKHRSMEKIERLTDRIWSLLNPNSGAHPVDPEKL